MKIIEFDSIASTQDEVEKYVSKGEDVIVRAAEQTGGKGTKGRSFVSKRGGLYFSCLKFHSDLPADKAYRIIENVSVAVALALKKFGVDARIKWPNDILVEKKKICGILTRSAIDKGVVSYSVIGVGINVNNEIDTELKDIAVSMKQITGYNVVIDDFFKELVGLLQTEHDESVYKSLSCVIGKRVAVTRGEETFFAVAEDVLSDGGLLLDNGEKLTYGEIKII